MVSSSAWMLSAVGVIDPQYPTARTIWDQLVVKMSTCYSYNASGTEPPLTIKKGSTISVNAWYYVGGDDPELGVDLGGTHMGVMSYMYLGYATAPDALEEDLKLLQEKGWEIVEA